MAKLKSGFYLFNFEFRFVSYVSFFNTFLECQDIIDNLFNDESIKMLPYRFVKEFQSGREANFVLSLKKFFCLLDISDVSIMDLCIFFHSLSKTSAIPDSKRHGSGVGPAIRTESSCPEWFLSDQVSNQDITI